MGTSKNQIVVYQPNETVRLDTMFYNLDAILSVGYRVNSRYATLFHLKDAA